jgi:hypothetical protein
MHRVITRHFARHLLQFCRLRIHSECLQVRTSVDARVSRKEQLLQPVRIQRSCSSSMPHANFGLSTPSTRRKVAPHHRGLSRYALVYWAQHRRKTAGEEFEPELRSKLKSFWTQVCSEDLYFAKWILGANNFRQLVFRQKDLEHLFLAIGIDVVTHKFPVAEVTNGRLIQVCLQKSVSVQPSLLNFALIVGDFAVAKLLVELGAPVDLRNKNNESPLVLAHRSSCKASLALLLGHGANLSNFIFQKGGSAENLGEKYAQFERLRICMRAAVEYNVWEIVAGITSERWHPDFYTPLLWEIDELLCQAIAQRHSATVRVLKDFRFPLTSRARLEQIYDSLELLAGLSHEQSQASRPITAHGRRRAMSQWVLYQGCSWWELLPPSDPPAIFDERGSGSVRSRGWYCTGSLGWYNAWYSPLQDKIVFVTCASWVLRTAKPNIAPTSSRLLECWTVQAIDNLLSNHLISLQELKHLMRQKRKIASLTYIPERSLRLKFKAAQNYPSWSDVPPAESRIIFDQRGSGSVRSRGFYCTGNLGCLVVGYSWYSTLSNTNVADYPSTSLPRLGPRLLEWQPAKG